MNQTQAMTREMQQCIQNCSDCHDICTTTAMHCLDMGGQHAARTHITTLLDCAQICHISADFMLRGSRLHTRTCAVCAEICDQCARECEALAGDDPMMTQCAEMCRQMAAMRM